MSYNKNTQITSELNARKSTLDSLQYLYKLEILGTVVAHGINDDYSGISYHPIRKLSCDKFVIMEQMQRTEDCDMDDFLVSYEFSPGKEPDNWVIEKFDYEEVDSHFFPLEIVIVPFETNPNVVGELLREVTFVKHMPSDYGCYTTFDVVSSAQQLEGEKVNEFDGNVWKRYFLPDFGLEVRWYWDGDGVLEYIFPNGVILSTFDSKTSNDWEWKHHNDFDKGGD